MNIHSVAIGGLVTLGVVLGHSMQVRAQESDQEVQETKVARGAPEPPAPAGEIKEPDGSTRPALFASDGNLKMMLGIIPVAASANFNAADRYHAGFATVQPIVMYDSSSFFLNARYRFYGGAHPFSRPFGYQGYFGEVSFLQYAFAGVKLTPKDTLTFGMQQTPFGITPFYSSSFFMTLGNQLGIEEVYNVGVRYQHKDDDYNLSIGYFPRDGGSYSGISLDSARYSPNIVRADSYVAGGTNNAEQHMFIGRGEYTLHKTDEASAVVGASFWLSGVYNADTRNYGLRRDAALHFVGNYRDWTVMAVGARRDIDAKNPFGNNDTVSFGLFDGSHNVATHGTFISGEVNYRYKPEAGSLATPFSEIQPFVNYSSYFKDKSTFRDSQRLTGGVAWSFRDIPSIQVFTEYRLGKNDPYTGVGQLTQGLAAGGTNEWQSGGLVVVTWFVPL